MRTLHVIVPEGLDDVTRPSGGNTYDLHLIAGLAEHGWALRCSRVRGSWPRPDHSDRTRLGSVLHAVADGGVALLDGLVACGSPEVIVPEEHRLRLVVLVHLPLGHRWGAGRPDGLDRERRERERQVLAAASAVVATSRWSRDWLLDAYDLDPASVHVAPPGASPAPLSPSSASGSRLLCVAAVTPTKGHDILVEALAAIRDLSWSCTCVGPLDADPAFVEDLNRRIEAAGLSGRLRLTGPGVGPQLQTMYAVADLVLVPSRIETYGLVATEALARGIPVIGGDVGGLAEAVDGDEPAGRPGLLVPAGDPASLAEALRRWLTDADLRQRLRVAALDRRAALRDWSATRDDVERVLAAVAA